MSDRITALRRRLAVVEHRLASLAGKNDSKSIRDRELLSREWDSIQSSLRGRRGSKRPA